MFWKMLAFGTFEQNHRSVSKNFHRSNKQIIHLHFSGFTGLSQVKASNWSAQISKVAVLDPEGNYVKILENSHYSEITGLNT